MVDTYNNTIVVRKSLNAPMASGSDFGADIGRAMQGVGSNIQQVSNDAKEYDRQAKIEQEKDDINAVVELESELSDFNRALLNEDIYARQGKLALGSQDEYDKKLEKWRSQAARKVQNKNQAEAFEKMYLRNRASHLDAVANHERQEKLRYHDETTTIRAQTAVDDALANYTDDKLVEQAFNSGLAAIKVNYMGRGELLEQKVGAYKSNFYKLGVLRRAEDNPALAKEYYESHKGDISGSEHQAIEKILRESGVNKFAMVEADKLWMSGKSEKEQLEDAYKINDPEKRDATINRIKARAADERRIKTQESAEKISDVYNQFNQTTSAVEAQNLINSIAEPNIKEQLRKEYEYKFNGKTRETNWLAYYDLQQLAAENPEKFKEVNLYQYKSEFNDGEFKELVKLQTNPNNKHLWEFRSRRDIVNQSLKAVGVTDKTNAGKKKIAQFYNEVENLAMVENADTPDKVKKLVDRLLIEGSVEGKWFSGKRLYEASEEEKANWVADEVPAAEKKKISDALLRRGEKVTDKRISELYNQKIKGGL